MPNFTDETAEAAKCQLFELDSDPVWTGCLVIAYIVTIFLCCSMTKVVNRETDTDHPVFGIIFHEAVVLSAAASSLFAVYVAKKAMDRDNPVREKLNFFVWVLASYAMFFHQISWLCITCLRYHLIVKVRNDDVDMATLRSRALRLIWLSTPVYLSLSVVPSILVNRSYGWPEVPLAELDPSVTFTNAVISLALSNVPDLACVAVYAKMWWKLRKKAPIPANGDGGGGTGDGFYGGIWVGDGQGIHPGEYPFGAEAEFQQQQHSPPLYNNYVGGEDQSSKAADVMKVLKAHAAVALLDVSSVVSSYFFCSKYGAMLAYGAQFLFGFWIPLFVISRNFKQFDSVWSHWLRKVLRL